LQHFVFSWQGDSATRFVVKALFSFRSTASISTPDSSQKGRANLLRPGFRLGHFHRDLYE